MPFSIRKTPGTIALENGIPPAPNYPAPKPPQAPKPKKKENKRKGMRM